MSFLIHLTIALISLFMIVLSCVLFTNAIEFLGNKIKLGNSATGSILAVIGTGLPEAVVPLVAIFGAHFSNIKIDTAQNIALGAILGSPFMLSTLALFLLGVVLIIKKRTTLNLEYDLVLRYYKYFLPACFLAFLFSFKIFNSYRIIAVILLLFVYSMFVLRTIIKSRKTCIECEVERLYFDKTKISQNVALCAQLFLSLFVLFLFSHFFVKEIEFFSLVLNVRPVILSLLITPFATELPECVNSIIWLKDGKDDLAIANVLGAVVFQTSVLFAMGMVLTPWVLDSSLVLNMILLMISGLVFVGAIIKNKIVKTSYLLFCAAVYLIYFVFIFVK